MKLLVVGAAGGVGKALVEQALAQGHEVTAFVHHPSDDFPSGVRVFEGDVKDSAKVAEAVAGQDAVLDAVGGSTPWKRTGLEPDAARAIVDAMRANGVRRLIVTSAMGVGDSGEVAGFFYEHILIPTFLRGTAKDKAEMERDLAATDLDWVVVRPAALTDDMATGRVKVFSPGDEEKAHKIPRADVAAFMLEQLTSDAYLRRQVTIATE